MESTDKSVMKFVYDLLAKYKELETKSKSNYIYGCHNEFDAYNATEFEELSNNMCIVVKTKLNPIHMVSIMRMFQSIYDDNYWPYEDLEYGDCFNCDIMLNKLYDDYPYDETEEFIVPDEYAELRQKLVDGDVDEWFKLYTSIAKKNYVLRSSVWSNGVRYFSVESEIIFFSQPKNKNKYNGKQIVYTLDDIMEMVVNKMN